MAVPDYQFLMLPVLMASADGEIRIGDAVDRLAEKLNLAPDERARARRLSRRYWNGRYRMLSITVFSSWHVGSLRPR